MQNAIFCNVRLVYLWAGVGSPGNCARDQQFGAILLGCMASLIIVLSRCSFKSLPEHTIRVGFCDRIFHVLWGTQNRPLKI